MRVLDFERREFVEGEMAEGCLLWKGRSGGLCSVADGTAGCSI